MVRLTIPAQLCFKELAFAATLAAIDAESDAAGPGSDLRDQIVSALGEALNNVVLHAYRGVRGGSIDMEVTARPGEVEIRILDRGRGFDPCDIPAYEAPSLDLWEVAPPEGSPAIAPSVEALPESGMGLFIMRSFMDDVMYVRGGGGRPNVLILRKRWSAGSDLSTGAGAFLEGAAAPKREASQSGWRMRSVAAPEPEKRAAGSLKRK